jgi:acyl transferase domain-containing protein
MASVFPLPEDELAPLVAQGSAAGDVFIANYNSPNQHVIGGTRAGVDAVCELVERTTTAQARTIDDRRAMHTPLFASVAAAFRPHVLRAPFRPLARPYLPNVLGHPAVDTQLGLLTDLLASHVERPVRFRHSVDWLVANTPDPIFVEVGAGSVLFNLLQRRWHPFRKLKTEDKDGLVPIARLHEGLGKGAPS